MSDTLRCPGCGEANPAGAESCARCNFPLHATDGSNTGRVAAVEPPAADPGESPPVQPFDPSIRRFRPIRPLRAEPMAPIQMQLWLFTGVAAVLLLVWYGAHGFVKSNMVPIEGAQGAQQQAADAARGVLEKDSTNVEARIALANVLYDTKNWPEAIVQYKSAVRLDPKRTTAIVDLGVCYYTLGQIAEADSLFHQALEVDPHQPIALFNLGIVREGREQWNEALQFYHRALQADPPEGMKPALMEHMQAVMAKLGKQAPQMPTGP